MGVEILLGGTANPLKGDATYQGVRVHQTQRGQSFSVSEVTGTVAAALAANSSVFAMRTNPGATLRAYIQRIRLQFSTIVAFTTPVTAGRRLGVFRGAVAAASGGTAITVATPKSTTYAASIFDTASGGAMSIATTGALTVTGISYEATPIRVATLAHVGNAGNFVEYVWEFDEQTGCPIILEPGQLIGIRNPAAMDAAGTWQLGVSVDWYEAASL